MPSFDTVGHVLTGPAGPRTPYVLVVDDDPDIRGFVTVALDDEGYRVAVAANGRQALDLIRQVRPDLVLLDLAMPIMTGWELHARLREYDIDVPIVFMTAGYRAQEEAASHRASGYLSKPFDLDELLRVVERFASPGDK